MDFECIPYVSELNNVQFSSITNALNSKTTIFFLSIFTQIVSAQTPPWLEIIYGAIISFAHLVWFSLVSIFFSHPIFLKKFNLYKNSI